MTIFILNLVGFFLACLSKTKRGQSTWLLFLKLRNINIDFHLNLYFFFLFISYGANNALVVLQIVNRTTYTKSMDESVPDETKLGI